MHFPFNHIKKANSPLIGCMVPLHSAIIYLGAQPLCTPRYLTPACKIVERVLLNSYELLVSEMFSIISLPEYGNSKLNKLICSCGEHFNISGYELLVSEMVSFISLPEYRNLKLDKLICSCGEHFNNSGYELLVSEIVSFISLPEYGNLKLNKVICSCGEHFT